MNKPEFIQKISAKTDIDEGVVEKVLNGFVKVVFETLKAGGEVNFTGFGKFLARFRSARGGVNPRNPSERIKMPEVTVPKFKAGKTFKDELKSSKAASSHNEPESEQVEPKETHSQPTAEKNGSEE